MSTNENATNSQIQIALAMASPVAKEAAPEPPKNQAERAALEFSKTDEIALQDVTKRQENLIQLIYHSERKALQLVGTYLALIGAGMSAGLALFNLGRLNRPALLAIMATLAVLYTAVAYAFYAQWTASINVTGRKPDFWQWAREHRIEPSKIVDAYLFQATENLERNERVNSKTARLLRQSYFFGLLAPPLGALTFACASYFG